MSKKVILAVFKRDFFSYFSSPTGYVFITLFIFMSAIAAFWPERFFLDNLANLNHLNELMPYLLLFFVPAITMNTWAGERSQGTDELLLTLPATDTEVVIGKYLSVLGIYTVSLGFSLSHVLVLFSLGSPDLGVMFGTYVGYWLMGATMLSIGLVASILTTNATIGFIYGSAFSAVFVFAEHIGKFFLPKKLAEFTEWMSIPGQFEAFGQGRFLLSSLFYFLGMAAVFVFMNIVLVNKRHWIVKGGKLMSLHQLARCSAVLMIAISVSSCFYSLGWGGDLTSERLHSLSDKTHNILADISKGESPVLIEAFVSPEVPKDYVKTRENLLATLKEFDRIGGSGVQLIIHNTEKYTEIARSAFDNYGIKPQQVRSDNSGVEDMFLSVAFRCGIEEDVVTLDKGLSIEYELTRSVRVVTKSERKVIGIMSTEARIFGGMDASSGQYSPRWSIVNELERQYKVKLVGGEKPIPTDIDALLVALPSALTQTQANHLQTWILGGGPTLLMDDPLPNFNQQLAASAPRAQKQPRNQLEAMMMRQKGGPKPKANLTPLYTKLGMSWVPSDIVFQRENPHVDMQQYPKEVMFLMPKGEKNGFNPESPIVSGLQELVMLMGGSVKKSITTKNTFTPLVTAGPGFGKNSLETLKQGQAFYSAAAEEYILAAQITGKTLATIKRDKKPAFETINTIFVADLDMISEPFFRLRRVGLKGLNFDNVTFVLNCIDSLCGEDDFVQLRKKRVKHRALTNLDKLTKDYEEKRQKREREAQDEAKAELEKAQMRFDKAKEEIRNAKGIDNVSKSIKEEQIAQIEKRRFAFAEAEIKEKKETELNRSKADKEIAVRRIQSSIRLYAVLLPPLPALLLALLIFLRRRKRENLGAIESRMV
ncbi:MAG: Gldg family protein [Planctomycetota bacterium]|nr:Gldg family protein [Planctomycetota bacterium]